MWTETRRFGGVKALPLWVPLNSGKTLLVSILARLMGTSIGRPLDFMTVRTQFNDELFESALHASARAALRFLL